MAVRPVVDQVDGGQQLRLKQTSLPIVEEVALLRVHRALNLTAIVVQLVERDPSVDVCVEVLHVVNLKSKTGWKGGRIARDIIKGRKIATTLS